MRGLPPATGSRDRSSALSVIALRQEYVRRLQAMVPTWRRHVYASAWRQLGFDALISDERAEDAAAAAAAVALDTAETPALASPTTRRAICCVKLLLNALDADDDDESESIRQRRRSDRGVTRETQSALDHLILGGRHTTQMDQQNQTQEQEDSFFLAMNSGGVYVFFIGLYD
jgi:hypothetical protein